MRFSQSQNSLSADSFPKYFFIEKLNAVEMYLADLLWARRLQAQSFSVSERKVFRTDLV